MFIILEQLEKALRIFKEYVDKRIPKKISDLQKDIDFSTTDDLIAALTDAKESGDFKGDKGDPGKQGNPGNDGKSAYDFAVEGGYPGSEAKFVSDLAATADTVLKKYTVTTTNDNLALERYYEIPNDYRYIRATPYGTANPGDLLLMTEEKTNACHSDYIDVSNAQSVSCYSIAPTACAVICFYNENKEYISCVPGTSNTIYKTYTTNIPEGAKYVMCSAQIAAAKADYVTGFKVEILTEKNEDTDILSPPLFVAMTDISNDILQYGQPLTIYNTGDIINPTFSTFNDDKTAFYTYSVSEGTFSVAVLYGQLEDNPDIIISVNGTRLDIN